MSDSKDSFKKVLDFLETADQLKSVERRGYTGDLSRHDNPAEHSWHMMLSMVLFNQLSDQKINLEHALSLAIIHDLVEIYAGDIPKYDEDAREEQKDIEQQAAQKLFSSLPENIGILFHQWWQEFEENQTPEAKFANDCDYLQGFTQSYIARGKSWKENGITKQITQKYTTPISERNATLKEFIDILYQEIEKKGLL